MGDSNAVDIAQEVHLNALQNKGCMNDSELLEYSRTFPAGPTFEGLYIDDHVILQLVRNRASGRRLTLEERKGEPPPRDKHLLELSREAYVEAGWTRSLDKVHQFCSNLTVWGTEIDNQSGRVGAPLRRRLLIAQLALDLISLQFVTRKAVEQVVGLLRTRSCINVFF